MTDVWHVDLPQAFQVSSYNEAEADNLIETPEVAVPKSRPISSAAARRVSGSMNMNVAQLAILRTFGRTTLLNWSLPFLFPAQSGDEDAANPGYWLVKFEKGGVPQIAGIDAMGGTLFSVSIKLWILP